MYYNDNIHLDILKMKTVFIPLCLFTILAAATASSFGDGMATGYIVNNVGRKMGWGKRAKTIKYNNITVDSALREFPKTTIPQCLEKKVILVKPPPTLLQKLISIVIMSMLMMMMTHMMCFADDETREWFLGYMIGQIIEGILNDDD